MAQLTWRALRARIGAYLRKRDMKPSTFGRLVANDGSLLTQLDGTRTARPAMLERIDKFLRRRRA